MEIVSSLIYVLSAFGAAIFLVTGVLLYWHGQFIPNLSIALKIMRHSCEKRNDRLVTVISMTKGKSGTIKLQALGIRVFKITHDSAKGQFREELLVSQLINTKYKTIDREGSAAAVIDNREVYLAPGEQTEFASYCEIEESLVCRIEVVLRANRYLAPGFGSKGLRLFLKRMLPAELRNDFSRNLYWMASAISVPNSVKPPCKYCLRGGLIAAFFIGSVIANLRAWGLPRN